MSPVEAIEEDAFNEGLNCGALDMFREYSKVKLMFQEIPAVVETAALGAASTSGDSAQFAAEKAFEDVKTILDLYQEQPHLLDPNLEELLGCLLSLVREAAASSASAGSAGSGDYFKNTKAPRKEVANQAYKYIYLLVKVRGYKVIVNKLPHEVSDLLPVLEMLEQLEDENTEDFYGSYVLLLWLSIVVYMPFNIADFDAGGREEGAVTVVGRLLAVVKTYLRSPQATRDMAAFLASKLVTRPDLRDEHLPTFVAHCTQVLEGGGDVHSSRVTFHRLGCLRALGLLWKHGRRQELLPLSAALLTRLQLLELTQAADSGIRKLAVKLVQRIGLTFLPPRLASWRYKRGQRCLAINMEVGSGGDGQQVLEGGGDGPHKKTLEEEPEDDGDVEVAPEMEEVINEMLKGLKDTDTVVRYSSSKGVGRMCSRLPLFLASDVVSAVLSSFTPRDTHNAWHGCCLALAELGRRGLLLPTLLPEVVAVLQKAFVYDKLMGQCSVGANIRDAACYLCWSLARAYDPSSLQPFVQELAKGLLVVSLFDREIPCRHAAAAAFQEHVGRQGSFPHGIDILTTVDYYSVGVRAHAYLKLAPFVASFPEYSEALVDHLVEHKLQHWDTGVRELAAKSLQVLTPHCPSHCSRVVLPALLVAAEGAVLVARHGAILALGAVVRALWELAKERGEPCQDYVDSSVQSSLSSLGDRLGARRLLQGVGGTYMRLALAELVYHVATAGVPVSRGTADSWMSLLEEGAVFVEEDVRGVSVRGLQALWEAYYSSSGTTPPHSPEAEADVAAAAVIGDGGCLLPSSAVDRYIATLSSERESQAQGMALALGALPRAVLARHSAAVVRALLAASRVTPETAHWAATRRDAVASVAAVASTAGLGEDGMSPALLEEVLTSLLVSLEDYTTDRRGDVGAWVREAAVTAIQSLLLECARHPHPLAVCPPPRLVAEAVAGVAQLAVERIDRTRRVAGTALAAIVHSCPAVPHIPDHSVLRDTILPASLCGSLNWGCDKDSFAPLGALLHLPAYRDRMIRGYAYSLGGVSATLAQSSSDALDSYATALYEEDEQRADGDADAGVAGFIGSLVTQLQGTGGNDRLVLPLLRTVEHFMTTSTLLDAALERHPALCRRLFAALRRQCHGCHDYHRIVSVAATTAEMLRLSCAPDEGEPATGGSAPAAAVDGGANSGGSSSSSITAVLLNQLMLFLGYQYPKVRTVTATALVTALQDYSSELLERRVLPSQDAVDELVEVLEDTPWMDAALPLVRERRNRCCTLLALTVPAVKKKTTT